jgi:hydroxyethylthiazole kinase-like uncharacterized protein yjeF
MEKLVSTKTMEAIDSKAQKEWAIPPLILMEQAGVRAWRAFIAKDPQQWENCKVTFIAGGGNNGGDALVMAREALFTNFKDITIILLGSRLSEASVIQRKIVENLGMKVVELEQNGAIGEEARKIIGESDLLVDGIVGSGLKGPLRGVIEELVELINGQKERGCHILSIDIPSGCGDPFSATGARIMANTTITMGLHKVCAYHPALREGWGTIIKVNPSFPPQLLEEAPSEASLSLVENLTLEPLEEGVYKNRRGHLALFAGSTTYPGAAKLVAKGAFNSRVGLVTLFCSDAVKPLVSSEESSLILRESQISSDALKGRYNAIVAGPGWSEGRGEQLLEILRSGLPTLLDAEAIALYATLIAQEKIGKTKHGDLILTPHPGELKRFLESLYMPLLAQESDLSSSSDAFLDALKRIAQLFEITLVYKSSVVWIVDHTQPPVVVEGRNNALGVAGSGDVLSGIIGSLLAQGLPPFEAAHKGVLIHQKGGVEGRLKHGYFDSDTLVAEVGLVCREAERRGAK